MTKPTSWCIDIRQEHPLLEKFKEWIYHNRLGESFFHKYGMGRDLWGFAPSDDGNDSGFYGLLYGQRGKLEIITLDQRRERRGKEYYETRK